MNDIKVGTQWKTKAGRAVVLKEVTAINTGKVTWFDVWHECSNEIRRHNLQGKEDTWCNDMLDLIEPWKDVNNDR